MATFLKSPLLDKFEDAENEIDRRVTMRKKSSIRLSISSSDLLPSDASGGEEYYNSLNEEPLITPSILPPRKRDSMPKGSVSTRTAYANVIKAYLGSGLLAIPYAFRCGGFLSGTVGLLLLALISNTTLKMLIWMRRRYSAMEGDVTFSSIGEHSTGVWGRRLALFAEIATNVGIAIGYLIFIGNTALIVLGAKASNDDDEDVTLHNKWLNTGSGSLHLNLIIVACAVPLFAFAQLRSMQKMGFVSIMGNVAVMSAIVVVTYTSISTVSWDDFPSFPKRDIDWTIRLAKMPYFFGIAMFSFTIHGIVLPIEASMKHPEDAYAMFDRCTLFVALSYVVFGGTNTLSLSLLRFF